jgi:hypothetical protein
MQVQVLPSAPSSSAMRLLRIIVWVSLVAVPFLLYLDHAQDPGRKLIKSFLEAKIGGRNTGSYCYGSSRDVMNPSMLDGMTGYKLLGKQHNQTIVEIQFTNRVERFRLHLLHGLIGRIDRESASMPPVSK